MSENKREYILEKTNVPVLPEKICMKEEKEYDSYKILIPKQKISLKKTTFGLIAYYSEGTLSLEGLVIDTYWRLERRTLGCRK